MKIKTLKLNNQNNVYVGANEEITEEVLFGVVWFVLYKDGIPVKKFNARYVQEVLYSEK